MTATIAALAALLLWLLDADSNHALSITPDGATALLEGHAMAGGNLALSGWSLSLDSFWGIDAAFYAVTSAIAGVRAPLLHFVPALLAMAAVAVAATLAAAGQRRGAASVGALTVIALLALPSPDLAYYLLQGPWHIGTAAYCLVAFGALARRRFDWRWAVAVVLLAVGLLSDLLTLAFGVLPCLVAGIAASRRARRLRAGLTSVTAALASLGAALLLRLALDGVGTFALVNRNVVVHLRQLRANVGHLANRLPALLGSGEIPLGPFHNGARAFQALHLLGVALVALAALCALARLVAGIVRATAPRGSGWHLDDLLLLATLADLGAFVWSSPNGHSEFAKYLTPAVIFSATLAGRLVARTTTRLRSRRTRLALGTGALALAATYLAEAVLLALHPAPSQPAARVAAFLAAHDLHSGIGDYWSAGLITVDSRTAVAVRPVTAVEGHLVRFGRQSDRSWYQGHRFDFLVFDTANPWHGVDADSGRATFGAPARQYEVGTYQVLVWAQPFTVVVPAPPRSQPLQVFWSLATPPSHANGDLEEFVRDRR